MRTFCLVLLLGSMLSVSVESVAAGGIKNNPRLVVLYEEDQNDRKGFPNTKLSYEKINERDEFRRQEILALLGNAKIRTAQDHFYAAVIFHHGQTNDHYRTATSFAWIAATLDPTNKNYLWLTASTWDRMMLAREQPQWYGAQEKRDDNGKQIGFHTINETAATDEERIRYQVKPKARLLAEPNQPARWPPEK